MRKRTLTVLSGALIMFTSFGQQKPLMDASITKKVIDSTCHALLRNYVYPQKASAMRDGLKKRLKDGAYDKITDGAELAVLLTRDIRSVHSDNHLSIRYDPQLEQKIREYVASSQKDPREAEKERKQNFFFRKVEILKGNIGYIAFNNFADTNESSRKTVRAAMHFVANSDAVILDLRNNFGGRTEMAREIASYFFKEPQLTGRTFNRINNTWTDDSISNRPKVTGGLVLQMPVYILTSERTFSAAEGLAYTLHHLRHAKLIGDTTRGGAHTTRSFAIGNGFVAFIPFTRTENIITGTDWEGTGVIPDVAVSEESCLPKAQELILKEQLQSVNNDVEMRVIQWLLNDLHTKLQSHTVPAEVLTGYTGQFEEFLFTLEGDKLYCRNTHERDKKDVLIPINDSLFKIDEQSQVEFIRDKNGAINAIRLLWEDGWVDSIQRSK
jgi:hypothetical protein